MPADVNEAPLDDVDAKILNDLAELYTTLDPVPAGLVERIRFGITFDALQAEIAELVQVDDLAGVRGEADEAKTVTFTSSTVTTMITISRVGADQVRVDGWVAPGGGCTVVLRVAGGSLEAVADADGRFVFGSVPRGMAQIIVRQPSGSSLPPVVTPSIEI